MRYLKLLALPVLIAQICGVAAQDKMDVESYNPKSTLVINQHLINRAKYPFIDVHNHQWNMPDQNLKELLNDMDGLNMKVMVNLSGRGYKMIENYHGHSFFSVNGPGYLNRIMDNVRKNGNGRLLVFTNLDFLGIDDPAWTKNTVAQLEKDVK